MDHLYLKGQMEINFSRLCVSLLPAVHCGVKQTVNSSLHLNPQEIYSSLSALPATSGANG